MGVEVLWFRTSELSNRLPKLPKATTREVPVKQPVRRPRRLSETEIEDLVRLRSEGWLVRELAVRFGIHRETAGFHVKRRGVN